MFSHLHCGGNNLGERTARMDQKRGGFRAAGMEQIRKRREKKVIKVIAVECVGVREAEAEETISPTPQAFVHFLQTDKKSNVQHHTTDDSLSERLSICL